MIQHGWENLFGNMILHRGMAYYYGNAVDQITKTDRGWRATVHGSRNYNVEITEENGSVKGMRCSCPYAQDGRHCKHEAALLFALSDRKNEKDETGDTSEEETMAEIIDAMSEAALREELKRIVSEEGHIRDRIFSRYRKRKAGPEEVTRIFRMLEDLAYEYGDRYGFIDWHAGSNYAAAFTSCLRDAIVPLLDNQEYRIAFDALEKAFYVLNRVEMDGSNGEHSELANVIADLWTETIHRASEAERDEMHQRLETLNETSEELICSDTIENLLENAFEDPKYVNALLEEMRKKLSQPHLFDYELRTCLPKYRDLLKRSGSDGEEYEQWLRDHTEFDEVKRIFYQRAVDDNNVPEQIRLLEELSQNEMVRWRKAELLKKLAELYRAGNDSAKEKEVLENMLLQQGQESLPDLQRLRSLYDPIAWKTTRDLYLSQHPSMMPAVYYEEGEYEKLLNVLRNGKAEAMDYYLDVLKNRYPEEVLAFYMNYLGKLEKRNPSAPLYEEMQRRLETAASIPGGRGEVLQLTDRWISKYPTRKKMLVMLRKIQDELSSQVR